MTLLYLALVLPLKKFYFNKYFIRPNLSLFTLMKYFRLLYLERNSSCLALMAPLLFFLIKSTASSYFIPSSINAVATNTGALRAECKIIRRCLQCWCSAARLTCQAQWHSEHQHTCLGFPWTLRLPERATVQWSPGKRDMLRQKTSCENFCRLKKCLDLDKWNMPFKGRGKVCSEATTWVGAEPSGKESSDTATPELDFSHTGRRLLRVAGWINQIQRSGMDYFWYMLL